MFNSFKAAWPLLRQDILRYRQELTGERSETLTDRQLFRYMIGLLHHDEHAFRSVFWYRVGSGMLLLRRIIPPRRDLIIWVYKAEGGAFFFHHPFSTIINCAKVGYGCRFRNNTTIGNKLKNGVWLRPTIGRNVDVGVSAIVVGGGKYL